MRTTDGRAATSDLIDALYACADDPSRWQDLIDAVERLPALENPDEAARLAAHAERATAIADRLRQSSIVLQGAARAWNALLLSAAGEVRAILGDPGRSLAPWTGGGLRQHAVLRIDPEVAPGYREAFDAAHLGRHGGVAHWSPGHADQANAVFTLLFGRQAMPDDLVLQFGLSHFGPEPLVALVVVTREDGVAMAETLREAFSLTAAEWRLAQALWRGETVTSAAARFGISPNTARTQVQAIFAKLGVDKQSELVARLDAAFRLAKPALGGSPNLQTPSRRFLRLADGRQLAYREYGDKVGWPVLFFHQWFTASALNFPLREAVRKVGVRLIAFDRPGVGQSTPLQDYRYETIAQDACALADALKLSRLAVLGASPGSAFALAASALLGDRVVRVGLLSPRLGPSGDSGPQNSPMRALAAIMERPWLARAAGRLLRSGMVARAGRDWAYLMAHWPADRAMLSRAETLRVYEEALHDTYETSIDGLISEISLLGQGPPFAPPVLSAPVTIWHGAKNAMQPLARVEALARSIPGARLEVVPDAGVLFDVDAYVAILTALAKPWRETDERPAN